MNKSTATSRSGKELVGRKAPGFVAPVIGAQLATLEDYRGLPLILNFWASWCPPCREETPGMERVWRKYRNDGLVILGVNVQDGEDEARRYINEFGVTFPNVLDLDGRVTIDYGVTGLPVTFFVTRDGTISGRWVGSISEARLDSWARSLNENKDIGNTYHGENPEGYRSFN